GERCPRGPAQETLTSQSWFLIQEVFPMVQVRQRPGPRPGFTLIEFMVVIAIIAVLMGMLVLAVQKARESADRIQSTNNLKQIGLAFQEFHQAYGYFPNNGRNVWSVGWPQT